MNGPPSGKPRAFLADPWLRGGAALSAAWLAGYAIATVLLAGRPQTRLVLADMVYLVPYSPVATLALLAGVRLSGRTRLFWLMLGVSVLLSLFGESTWAWYELIRGVEPPSPSMADIGYLASYAVVIPAVVIGFSGASRERHLRAWLDAGIVTVGMGTLGWRLLVSPLLGPGPVLDLLSQAAYPLLDIALLVLLVSLGLAGHRDVPLSVVLVMASYAVATLGDAIYSFLVLHELYESGGWIDLTWQVQVVVLGLAAASALRLRDADPPVALMRQDLALWPVLAGVALGLGIAVTDARRGGGGVAGLVAIALTVAALVARLQLTIRDQRKIGSALDSALREQERLAVTDELTSLYNRRYVIEAIRGEVHKSNRTGEPIGLLVLDLDRFKTVNDTYGHDAGDLVLAEAAVRLSSSVREGDTVARYGGEEFLVLLPGADSDTVTAIGERCRRFLQVEPIRLADGTPVSLTTSVGGCSLERGTYSEEELITLADRAVYEAKRRGRNRMIMAVPGQDPAMASPQAEAIR